MAPTQAVVHGSTTAHVLYICVCSVMWTCCADGLDQNLCVYVCTTECTAGGAGYITGYFRRLYLTRTASCISQSSRCFARSCREVTRRSCHGVFFPTRISPVHIRTSSSAPALPTPDYRTKAETDTLVCAAYSPYTSTTTLRTPLGYGGHSNEPEQGRRCIWKEHGGCHSDHAFVARRNKSEFEKGLELTPAWTQGLRVGVSAPALV